MPCQPQDNCVNCAEQQLQMSSYCSTGCATITQTDCVQYSGQPITTDGLNIQPGDDLTDIINDLAQSTFDIPLNLTWNLTTRQLCLIKNSQVVVCVTIPDSDNQALNLSGTILQIVNPNGQIQNSVDLSTVFPTIPTWSGTSRSLIITPGGVDNFAPTIEVQPSGDFGNSLVLGSDNRPYVPTPVPSITAVNMMSNDCISFTQTLVNGVLTVTSAIDWQCVANNVCALCNPGCGVPSSLTVTTV